MNKKEKEIRKQKFKNILLRTLHIICYILSILFILVCVVGGVQSCSNKHQSVNAENEYSYKINKYKSPFADYTDYNYYEIRYSNLFTLSLSDQQLVGGGFVNVYQPFNEQQYDVYAPLYNGGVGDVYLFDDVNGRCKVDFVYGYFKTYQDTDNHYYFYRLYSLFVQYYVNDSLIYSNLLYKNFTTAQSLSYQRDFGYGEIIADKGTDFYNDKISVFYSPHNPTKFIFNKQWNYNAPLNTNINGVYGTGSFTYIGDNSSYNIYDTGYFISNGQLFNQIKIWYFKTGAIDVLFSDGIGRAPSGYYVYAMTQYLNTETNYSIVVNIHDQVPFKTNDGGYTYYYANSSTWKNDNFRSLVFLESLSENLVIDINSFNNNNQNSYSGQIFSDGSDVFTLLSLGFSSLSDFWAISILPGISIGVLFFLPAVVGILITIVHLLRK